MAMGSFGSQNTGQEMYGLIEELYPICRSITGDGVRETLNRLQRHIPLVIHEVPTGTQVFDWTIPHEWNIRDAYVKDEQGDKVIDFHQSNLHVVSYSVPVRQRLSLAELKQHLFTLPEYPDWIPYRTSYYEENWGFCLSHRGYLGLSEGQYEVFIDSSLAPGHLSYGEYYLPGATEDEFLVSCHICHPSLCNDNLSGVSLAAFLAKYLSGVRRRLSYRFLFIPGTIGSITWLSRNESSLGRVKHGLVLTCVGDSGSYTYKKSRQGNAEIDRVFQYILKHSDKLHRILEFSPYGYDERQFCSPAFDLPVGCLMRTPHGEFPQYHTSADDLDFVRPEFLADAFDLCLSALQIIESNLTYVTQNPKCEPQLGKRGLYPAIGGYQDPGLQRLAILWVLNLADGRHTLLDMADRAGIAFTTIADAAQLLQAKGLLEPLAPTITINS